MCPPKQPSHSPSSYQRGDPYLLPLPPPIDQAYAQRTALALCALLFRLERESNGQFVVVRMAAELRMWLDEGVVAAVLHFEGAEPIDPGLDALEVFHQAGLRSLGLTWSRPNAFATGVPFGYRHDPDIGPGLTDAGKARVRVCNELDILIDLSHLNARGFWDVAALSDAPLVGHALQRLCPLPLDAQPA